MSNTTNNLKKIDCDELVEELDELEETNEIYNVDKLWDGLHFLLIGVSASSPIEGNKLSEAIVGINVFETDGEYFVSYIEKDELFKELINEYNGLLDFYKKAFEKNMNIIFSVL